MRLATLAATLALAAIFGLTLLGGAVARAPESGLTAAIARGDLNAIQQFVATGGDPNGADDPHGFRPLATAARDGRLDVMAALLSAGADPNLRDPIRNRWVPLMHAVHKHQLAGVAFLLEHGAKADGPADLRLTPLMMAAASGQTLVVRLLLDAGADPHRRAPDDASVMTLAVSGGALTDIDEPLLGGCHPDTVRLLRERAPDITLDRSIRGRLAVLFARLNGCHETLALIGH